MTTDAQCPIHALVTAIAPVDQHNIVDLRDQYVIADIVAHMVAHVILYSLVLFSTWRSTSPSSIGYEYFDGTT